MIYTITYVGEEPNVKGFYTFLLSPLNFRTAFFNAIKVIHIVKFWIPKPYYSIYS